ncbi:hypothetical protein C7N83_08840 [Neisseria iguanae]|uniref:Uncharacterized protein n=1 Tax=Neisseria iguanae TaxID=90242 RepID=A0A2P7TZ98_9NEIS|nr:hypothetical protein C7N83_08840 [Neisseria iguanae]
MDFRAEKPYTRQVLKEGGFTRDTGNTSRHSKVGHLAGISNAVGRFYAENHRIMKCQDALGRLKHRLRLFNTFHIQNKNLSYKYKTQVFYAV